MLTDKEVCDKALLYGITLAYDSFSFVQVK